jgi:hypothetical protein
MSNGGKYREDDPNLYEGQLESSQAGLKDRLSGFATRDREQRYEVGQKIISFLSRDYDMPKEYIEEQLYKQDLDLYKHVQSLESGEGWLGESGEKQFMTEGKPERGYPSFRTRKKPGSGPRGGSLYGGYDEFSLSSRPWMVDPSVDHYRRVKGEGFSDERELMKEMQKDYVDYKSKIRRTAEDKIMNGFLQQDNEYKIGE